MLKKSQHFLETEGFKPGAISLAAVTIKATFPLSAVQKRHMPAHIDAKAMLLQPKRIMRSRQKLMPRPVSLINTSLIVIISII